MRPTQRLFWFALGWTLLGLLAALNNWLPAGWSQPEWQPQLSKVWQISTATLLFLLLFDVVAVRRMAAPTVRRSHSESLALGVWSVVELELLHRYRRPVSIEVHDHYPGDCEAEHALQNGRLQPRQGTAFRYRVRAKQRGNHDFGLTDLLLPSPMGFWQRRLLVGTPSRVKVYPNFAAVSNYAMMSMEQQSSQLGIRLQQRRGEGMEFQQLREFRQGDSLRQIDWNASARLRKLISKEYQDEKDQQILFLVDCGRRMRSKDGDHSHLDHALNAMLLMSYAALKQGDAVGLLSFGGDDRWLKPVKGVANLSKILNCVYDVDASTRASDYNTAIRALMTRHQKRALVVLLSNIRDENVDDLKPALSLLRKKHLVMVANLEEPELHELLEQPIHQFQDALRYAGTKLYLERRQAVTRAFNHSGIHTVNSTPQMMPVALINKYFEVKREGLL
ncbi:DUF58 domain-containing protein [Ketobacter sp.]|uniref:DUF58 domain-containing protein n=1 Tax=Ketobacter sp. TaxID=2083498 RepID=UPI000F1030F3|nr:DUF58 domain-containing protein [Ketobacter sp.]RLU01527.1 MAG: DUF58 domain-containing protein [Ketobacter sp.]